MIDLEEVNPYKALGDVHPLLHGGTWVKKIDKTRFNVIRLDPIPEQEGHYILQTAEVDTSDSWIDDVAVMNYIGVLCDTDNENYASAVLDYYGAVNCGGVVMNIDSRKDAKEALLLMGVLL